MMDTRCTMRLGWCVLMTAVAGAVAAGAGQERVTISLDEGWRAQRVNGPESLPTGRWRTVSLPHVFPSRHYQSAWYEKEFPGPTLPPQWRAVVEFGGVKYDSTVWLNGVRVGGHFGGYDAFTVDVTKALKPGTKNVLRIHCHDWTGVFSPGPRLVIPRDIRAARSFPRNRVLAPIGGRFSDFGLWDRVELHLVPPVRVARAFIETAVRDGRLTVRAEIENDTRQRATVTLRGRVLDATGAPVKTLPRQQATVPPGDSQPVRLSVPAKLSPWSPEDPYLHTLELTVRQSGKTIDVWRQRFGWRQLWREGPQFYLNGVPCIIRASAGWPVGLRTRDDIARFWRQIKGANCFAFRTHTQPWPERFYEVADEVGILLIPEGAVWNDDCSYRIDDPAFWRNYRTHIESMIRHLGNHACVVMWSLENEMYGGCLNERNVFATRQLADLVRFAQRLAPTQLVTLESDGDPLNSVDVIGIHYPWELPNVVAYPDDAYWLDEPIPKRHQYQTEPGGWWQWKRNKPLYLGEYLWCPDNTPGVGTVFFGDDAYAAPRRYHRLAKAEAWRFQTEAYRYYRVSGLCPWTLVEGGRLNPKDNPLYAAQREAMAPLAVYPVEWNTRFFGGRRVVRHVRVFNDSFHAAALQFRWAFTVAGKSAGEGVIPLQLHPCEFRELPVDLQVPVVSRRESAGLELTLWKEGKQVFAKTHSCSVWPSEPFPSPPPKAVLFDPTGVTARLVGKGWKVLKQLRDVPEDTRVLFVGVGAFPQTKQPSVARIGGESTPAQRLVALLRRGCTVVMLRQQAYPAGLLPVGLTDKHATLCFPTLPQHPVLAGINWTDLRYWAGDGEHGVSVNEPTRPVGGRALVVSGGKNGLATAPLCELPLGAGRVILCQLRVVEKANREPAARRLLTNLIRYAANPWPATRKVRKLTAPDRVWQRLKSTRVTLAGKERTGPEIRFSSGPLTTSQRALAQAALARGDTLYLHRPDAATVRALLPPDTRLELRRTPGSVARTGTSVLARHVLREDLYWLDLTRSYHPLPPATDMIDSALVCVPDLHAAVVIPAAKLQFSGPIVERRGKEIVCATVGEVSAVVDFGAGGPRLVGGTLGGTPAAGRFPIVDVRIDDVPEGQLALAGGAFRAYALRVAAPPGRHKLSLVFLNDANLGGEDRNLFVRSLLVQPAPGGEKLDFVTSPGAVVSFPAGRGTVLIDCLRWDDSPHADGRGRRALADLLTGLGAAFSLTAGSVVEAETMTVKPPRRWNQIRASELYLGTTGGAETTVEVVRAGRYAVDLVGWGTPCAGGYPVLQLLVNGRPVGKVELVGSSPQPQRLGVVSLPRGKVVLRVEFLNDLNAPPEDRNAHLDRLTFQRVE